MTELRLFAITIKKYKPHSSKKVIEDLEKVLKRDFTTTSINEKWVGDITYIHTIKDGWCYLASVLDLHSNKIIRYAFDKKMTNNLVTKALKNAYYSQRPNKNKLLIFHTDLCSQYTSNDLKELCKEFNITQSFSKKGCPYDNTCIESFHSPIKKEEIYSMKDKYSIKLLCKVANVSRSGYYAWKYRKQIVVLCQYFGRKKSNFLCYTSS